MAAKYGLKVNQGKVHHSIFPYPLNRHSRKKMRCLYEDLADTKGLLELFTSHT